MTNEQILNALDKAVFYGMNVNAKYAFMNEGWLHDVHATIDLFHRAALEKDLNDYFPKETVYGNSYLDGRIAKFYSEIRADFSGETKRFCWKLLIKAKDVIEFRRLVADKLEMKR